MKIKYSRQSLEKYSNIRFYESLTSGSRVVACGQMGRQTDKQTGVTTLIVAFAILRTHLTTYEANLDRITAINKQ
jgi:phosphoheptose isomerase